LNHRRQLVKPQTAGLNRTESKGHEKAELEGTAGSSTFEWRPKPELPSSEETMHDKPNDTFSRRLSPAGPTQRLDIHQELEAVSRVNPCARGSQIPFSSTATSPSQPLEELSTAAASGLSESVAADGGVVVVSSSSQEQAVVDASQLDTLKAQERELAEYIEAHETLQKLKNEHIALQERIRAAEERVQRSKTSDVS
jgi:hypothetical protein